MYFLLLELRGVNENAVVCQIVLGVVVVMLDGLT